MSNVHASHHLPLDQADYVNHTLHHLRNFLCKFINAYFVSTFFRSKTGPRFDDELGRKTLQTRKNGIGSEIKNNSVGPSSLAEVKGPDSYIPTAV